MAACVRVYVYRRLFSPTDTEDGGVESDDSDYLDSPPVKRRQVCQIHIGVNNQQQRTIGLLPVSYTHLTLPTNREV